MELMIEDLMEQLIEMGGSDMHLSAGLPPYFRLSGKLTPIGDEPMTSEQCQRLIFSMLNNTQRKNLEQNWELDCSYGVKGLARFRVNVYKDRGTYAACLRALSSKIPSFDKLGLPDVVREMSEKPRGLILVTGPTGSGKTTTLAAMIDVFPSERQQQVRVQLSNSLVAVFSQTLVSRKNPKPGEFGRVMAQEIMVVTPAIANLIREGKTSQIYSAIQTGGKLGMVTLEKVLADLYKAGMISFESAMAKTSRPDELQRLIGAAPAATGKPGVPTAAR